MKKIIAKLKITGHSVQFTETSNIDELYEREYGILYETKDRKLEFKSVDCPEFSSRSLFYLPGDNRSKDTITVSLKIPRTDFINYLDEFVKSRGFKLDNTFYNSFDIFIIW